MRFRLSPLYTFAVPPILIAICVYIQSYGSRNSTPSSKSRRLTADDIAREFIERYGRFRVLEDSICLDDGTCVNILDNARQLQDGRYYFYRSVYYDRKEVTAMNLKAPKELSKDYLDTSKWQLDKTSLNFYCYTPLMIEEMFVSGAVEMNRQVESNVLSIGLGAGYMNSYLHGNYPKMNITVVEIEPKMVQLALKWFDLALDDLHRVITMDGAEFLKKAAEEGVKFDVVHIDACQSEDDAEISCPAPAFSTSEVAEILSEVVTNKGVVIMNLLSLKLTRAEAAKKALHNLKRFFKNCIETNVEESPPNVVVTCSQRGRPEGLKEKYNKFVSSTM